MAGALNTTSVHALFYLFIEEQPTVENVNCKNINKVTFIKATRYLLRVGSYRPPVFLMYFFPLTMD